MIVNSAARCAGASIRVNDALLSGPFTVWAIGNPANLESALRMPGGLVEKLMLEPLGMITIERRSDIKIPAFSGSLRYEYARPLGASRPMDAQ